MIDFVEVYCRAVYMIKDPHLSRSFSTDTIRFCKEMYPFLRNGVSKITAPPQVAALLAEQQPPEGKMEIFEGTGEASYMLSVVPPPTAMLDFYIEGKKDTGAKYDPLFTRVTFSSPIQIGQQASVEWYVAGGFVADFSKVNGRLSLSSLVERLTDMLAQATAISWGGRERNSLLDGVLNNLTDTDFKVHSPAAALTAKKDWVKELRLELMNAQQQLGWDLRLQNRSFYGY